MSLPPTSSYVGDVIEANHIGISLAVKDLSLHIGVTYLGCSG